MPQLKIEAPAKLNLHLKVGDRRPDGFHDIESLFLALAFGDTLYLETIPSVTKIPLEIRMDWQSGDLSAAISPEKNIISRAVSLFRNRTGFDTGLKVTVKKRIPLGGGLGGGSSDAAAALLALNCLASDGKPLLSNAELAEMGASLGSDVPFFLCGAPAAWVTGRGEAVQPLELPESALGLSLVLVNPGFSSDTAEAYRLLDYIREERREKGEERKKKKEENLLLSSFSPFHFSLPTPCFFNDFLPVLTSSEKGAIYQQIISELRDLGADFTGLSGSGSTCFGIFSEHAMAESVKKTLLKRWPFVINTFPLAHRTIPYYNKG